MELQGVAIARRDNKLIGAIIAIDQIIYPRYYIGIDLIVYVIF